MIQSFPQCSSNRCCVRIISLLRCALEDFEEKFQSFSFAVLKFPFSLELMDLWTIMNEKRQWVIIDSFYKWTWMKKEVSCDRLNFLSRKLPKGRKKSLNFWRDTAANKNGENKMLEVNNLQNLFFPWCSSRTLNKPWSDNLGINRAVKGIWQK